MTELGRYSEGVALRALVAINAAWKPLKKPAKKASATWIQWNVPFRPGFEEDAIKELVRVVKRSGFIRFRKPKHEPEGLCTFVAIASDPLRRISMRVAAQHDVIRDTTYYRLDCTGSKS